MPSHHSPPFLAHIPAAPAACANIAQRSALAAAAGLALMQSGCLDGWLTSLVCSQASAVGAVVSDQLVGSSCCCCCSLLLLLLALTMTSLACPAVLLSVGRDVAGGGWGGIQGLLGLVLTSALTKARIALSSAWLANSLWQRLVSSRLTSARLLISDSLQR